MKRFITLFLIFVWPLIAYSQMSGVSLRSLAQAFLLSAPAQNTSVPGQNGLSWRDGKLTISTPNGNLQFGTTGDPAEPVITWPGRIMADHIDVTSMSPFREPPTTGTELGNWRQMAIDENYIYVWTANNVVKRAALSSF